jgi:hypothetical protein
MASTDTCGGVTLVDTTLSTARRARVHSNVRTPGAPWQQRPAPVLGGGAPMTAIGSFEFNTLPDSVLLAWLTANGHRPNVLIECQKPSADIATRHLMTWCGLPFRYCALPGRLELPTTRKGTLLLRDVAALTLSQQVMLYDWLSTPDADMQVISLATTPLRSLVEDGEFLEGLFYRLNVIRLDAVHGTRPAPPDTWQETTERMS